VVAAQQLDTQELERALVGVVDGEVRFDPGSRAAYAQDSSNYRLPPVGVVVPRSRDAAVAAISVCAGMGVPVLSRGGGTSLAGQCCNEAVVIDWTKYCHRVLSADPGQRTVTVEPGIALDKLNDAMQSHGLIVGPRPSTHVSCTIGGMIGNNSCGSMAQAYGKMEDSVVRLEICTYDGLRTWVGPTSDEEYAQILAEGGRKADIYQRLRALRDACMGEIRVGFPKIPRRVSGYNLDHLLPEKGFNIARALVGSESTVVTVLAAEISLVEAPKFRSLVILGYPDIVEAAKVVPLVNEHAPLAAEGLDDTLIELEREEHFSPDALSKLPSGAGWMMVQFGGDSLEEAEAKSKHFVDDCLSEGDHPKPRVAYLEDPRVEDELWDVREASLGATAYPPHMRITHEGWEDAAVPPDRLAEYLGAFRRLLKEYHYESASLYGHFGQGCVHTRIPFDLGTDEGVATYRDFVSKAAELVVSFGGSLSGEHGDGQSRGELLPKMFSPPLMRAFGEFKAIFDPDDKMNPGKVVRPRRLDDNLTLHNWPHGEPQTFFHYPEDGFQFSKAASRCVGNGKCRGDEGGQMCPSYRVTREEEDSTRGRARLLMEMVRGDVLTDGWRSEEVRDALDLCLACKGCRKECPVEVDMATYKAEFLAHHYAGRLRPVSHYSMGWLPLISRLVTAVPGVARPLNAALRIPAVASAAKRGGGIAPERDIPAFATESFTKWFRKRGPREGGGRRVVLWPDSFSNYFHPEVGQAAVRVLESAGFSVSVPSRPVCCGLTWITTGQLGTARRLLQRSLRTLLPELRAEVPVVVLEPSCAAVFRSDAAELLGTDHARLLAERTKTLAEILTEADWPGPGGDPSGGAEAGAGVTAASRKAVAQVHCHQHAILGFDADRELLRRCGVDLEVLDSGCCGLAGNFGFERGHYEVSAACAERGLWPAARNAEPGTVILADGFSCRTQLAAVKTEAEGLHLAQLLDRLRGPAD
jgi:FAD/FMN-containing dehydrogenase/Fe-S oxidoreductase